MKNKDKKLKDLNALCEKFNNTFKTGDKCKIENDEGRIEIVTVKAPASVIGGHSSVGWFDEISGCYDLTRVQYEN